MLTGPLPVPFPSFPARSEGPGSSTAPTPAAWGKLLWKVKVVLAGLPEIPNVRSLGWEGSENNVGALPAAGRMRCDKPGFQACCRSSSLLPGTPAGMTLNPSPQGGFHSSTGSLDHWWLQGASPLQPPLTAF